MEYQRAIEMQEKLKQTQDQRDRKQLEEQIKRGGELLPEVLDEPKELVRAEGEKIVIGLKPNIKSTSVKPNPFKVKSESSALSKLESKQEISQEKPTSIQERPQPWILPNIVVKINDPSQGKYHLQKGKIEKTDKFAATVQVLDSNEILQLHEKSLQTVFGRIGGNVLILKRYSDEKGECLRGCLGVVEDINEKNFEAGIRIQNGRLKGTLIDLPYDDFSKTI